MTVVLGSMYSHEFLKYSEVGYLMVHNNSCLKWRAVLKLFGYCWSKLQSRNSASITCQTYGKQMMLLDQYLIVRNFQCLYYYFIRVISISSNFLSCNCFRSENNFRVLFLKWAMCFIAGVLYLKKTTKQNRTVNMLLQLMVPVYIHFSPNCQDIT